MTGDTGLQCTFERKRMRRRNHFSSHTGELCSSPSCKIQSVAYHLFIVENKKIEEISWNMEKSERLIDCILGGDCWRIILVGVFLAVMFLVCCYCSFHTKNITEIHPDCIPMRKEKKPPQNPLTRLWRKICSKSTCEDLSDNEEA
ncbi:hypothetical protein JTB14_008096 [Gonioctena quinquepunctata]|nr:hypothetical protein JTB14_008096 [Gonioctena quinquepunctata]